MLAKTLQEKIESGNAPDDIWRLLEEYPYHVINDKSGLTLSQMSHTVDEYTKSFQRRPEFVVVDYLELLGGAKASGEGYLATEMQATMLKDWAKAEEMRVYVLHQANKQEQRWLPPTDSSARNGGYTEADFVIGMWRPHLNPKLPWIESQAISDTISFNVLKNRAFFRESSEIKTYISPSLRIEGQDEFKSTVQGRRAEPRDNTNPAPSPNHNG